MNSAELEYTFPEIRNISDVQEHIDEDHFRTVVKDHLTFINYNLMGSETFPDIVKGEARASFESNYRASVRRECRGICFDTATGDIVSRPFHKFFNWGERESLEHAYINGMLLNREHVVYEKLDGSMIRPLPTPAGPRWGTKMGITDVAMLAETRFGVEDNYRVLAEFCFRSGLTPLFEFCSKASRIVLDYPEDRMVLLAVRVNVSGKYFSRHMCIKFAHNFGLEMARPSSLSLPEVAGAQDAEGVVITLDSGHMVKVKSAWYRQLHRVKDMLATERRLVELIYANGLDDLLPILEDARKERIVAFSDAYTARITRTGHMLSEQYQSIRAEFATKKGFALSTKAASMHRAHRAAMFSIWDEKAADGVACVLTILSNSFTTEAKYDEMKTVLGTTDIIWEA